jgi:4-hydroxy-tetrahydrodipicolinate synthase
MYKIWGKFMLQGLITAIATPYTSNGEKLDFDSLKRLIEYQVVNGASGLVVLGTTGESAMLSDSEKLQLIQKAIEFNAKRAKIIVGVSQISTAAALEWVNKLNLIAEVDYLLVVTPPYVKATPDGLYAHFSQIAQLSSKPIILYNVPSRTSCNLSDEMIIKLSSHDNIIGIKDATGDISRCSWLVKHRHPEFKLFSGDDATALAFTLCGGDGAISVTGNVVPQVMSQMLNHAVMGNKAEAIKLNNQILELHDVLFIEANPIPLKWVLFKMGIISYPELRLPLQRLNDKYHSLLETALARANLPHFATAK